MSITICDTHLARTVRYLSLTFEPVDFQRGFYSVLMLFSHGRVRFKVYVKFCDLLANLIGML